MVVKILLRKGHMLSYIVTFNGLEFELIGAGGGSRTHVSALGRLHNSRYTTPAKRYSIGATYQDRTDDLHFTKVALYQLS